MNIKEASKTLKLSYLRENHEEILEEAKNLKLTNREFLELYLERELERRQNNGITRRIKNAKFTNKKFIEDFDKSKYSLEINNKFEYLEKLKFIDNKENIILIGTPGCGKTHYATALGIRACMNEKSVLFTSVPNLVIELQEAMSKSQITNYKKRFEKYDLVILDELGYVSFDKTGCEILFNLLSSRNDKGSIIVTTNLDFNRWEEIFKDPMLTGAMVDRLAHRAHIMDMSREISYRMEDTISWSKEIL
ncbi:IS21 family transposase ISHahy12 [Fusobacterium sp. DD29]|uniref:IS21-like element helper ATPase IstB n=1 Tax=unclassified Fusobacterium TaxID=2648384 RepID=UPI001B8D90D6|nr:MULTISPECIES: IS21-like element helper ATPase IstB [unclassified Fusobacterium]MBR8748557.1 IS21 family transposase ISHahy12 [Fusobacterium sp. DD29]MBR8760824.1 IS21 family transposase ISHahy12 [Fusobacterium sp. DD25]MBR8766836.1 IS21 family transposase ISHahy12 [Fusobacterium sp. DD43]MBR8770837.1 IS21 family transposase ISHahy12 [Fusobacterium sp. DD40]MBR8775149.1 IS21 family transposase ISHahy12 [Fusobacterium sp. DD17]